MLEVIALNLADVKAAELGGADQVELVGTMEQDGLSPSIETVAEISRSTNLKLRVMLRLNSGFRATNLDRLKSLARELDALPVAAMVLGFLDEENDIDLKACEAVIENFSKEITFHRALDHSRNYFTSLAKIATLSQVNTVLTAGDRAGVSAGINNLKTAAKTYPDLIMAGGGLKIEHLAELKAAGITKFHLGSAVREGGKFTNPLDPTKIKHWQSLINQ